MTSNDYTVVDWRDLANLIEGLRYSLVSIRKVELTQRNYNVLRITSGKPISAGKSTTPIASGSAIVKFVWIPVLFNQVLVVF